MSAEWMVVYAIGIAPLFWAIGMLIGWIVKRRRTRPVLPAPTLASIMREQSMRRELELADWDAEFSVASHEAKHGVTVATEGYPCSVGGKICPCGSWSTDCR